MPRYKLTLEYDGTPFAGWQRQKNAPSVQEALEDAAGQLSASPVTAAAAGRTDAGVHALGMVAHLDLDKDYPADKVADALNFHLKPLPVAVIGSEQVDGTFHARFSCVRRSYLYRLAYRRAPLVLDRERLWQRPYRLDVAAMDEAAQALAGKHDFTTFRSTACQAASPVKTLEAICVRDAGDEVHVSCQAPSFLHNQIRSFVGSLERVGAGRWPVEQIAEALNARDRTACGPVAPPHGLYFVKAEYPAG